MFQSTSVCNALVTIERARNVELAITTDGGTKFERPAALKPKDQLR